MKKLTTALLAAAALTTAVSAEGGFYLGANAGVANTNVKYSFVSEGGVAGLATQNYNSTAGKMAGLFGVFAGYGMTVGQGAYLGGEAYGGFDTTKVNAYDDSASTVNGFHKTTVKRTNFYGLAARIGYMVTPSTLAYVRLAVEAGKWTTQIMPNTASVAANNNGGTTSQVAAMQATVTKNKNSINFAPGLGFEVSMNKNLFVRAEYSYLFGPSLTGIQDTSHVGNGYINGNDLKHTTKISQHAFKVGVGYKF